MSMLPELAEPHCWILRFPKPFHIKKNYKFCEISEKFARLWRALNILYGGGTNLYGGESPASPSIVESPAKHPYFIGAILFKCIKTKPTTLGFIQCIPIAFVEYGTILFKCKRQRGDSCRLCPDIAQSPHAELLHVRLFRHINTYLIAVKYNERLFSRIYSS